MLTVKQRNKIIRKVAEHHAGRWAYGSDTWRRQMAYWIWQVRKVAQ